MIYFDPLKITIGDFNSFTVPDISVIYINWPNVE